MKIIDPKTIDKADIPTLPELEQKLLLMHFSPHRTDCVEMNYTYRVFADKIYLIDPHHDIDLTDEVERITYKELAHEYGLPRPPKVDYQKYVFEQLTSQQ